VKLWVPSDKFTSCSRVGGAKRSVGEVGLGRKETDRFCSSDMRSFLRDDMVVVAERGRGRLFGRTAMALDSPRPSSFIVSSRWIPHLYLRGYISPSALE
jgi:hypothetical protein